MLETSITGKSSQSENRENGVCLQLFVDKTETFYQWYGKYLSTRQHPQCLVLPIVMGIKYCITLPGKERFRKGCFPAKLYSGAPRKRKHGRHFEIESYQYFSFLTARTNLLSKKLPSSGNLKYPLNFSVTFMEKISNCPSFNILLYRNYFMFP